MFDPLDHDYPIDDVEYTDILNVAWDRCLNNKQLTWCDALPTVGAVFATLPLAYGLEWICNSMGCSLPGIVLGLATVVPLALALIFAYRRRYRREVLAELRTRGHNVCPKCGYHRAGLDDTAPCPECGIPLPHPH